MGAGTGMNIWNMSAVGLPPIAGPSQRMPDAATVGVIPKVFMWWTMMLAMMMPGAFRHLPAYRFGVYSPAATLCLFWASYAGIWLMFSFAVTGIQYLVVNLGFLHGMKMWSSDVWFSFCLLAFAGLYQFTSTKADSLQFCIKVPALQPPLKSGASYGFNCLRSSSPLMLLLFVGGVMNVYWVVALSVLVTVEKALPHPKLFSFAIGLACLSAAAGAVIG